MGMKAMGVLLFFSAVTAGYAGVTLVWRGTALDGLWALNPRAHTELTGFGAWIGMPFLLLSAGLLTAGTGWFRRRLWGWCLAVGIIVLQMAGDFVNVFRGDLVRGAAGAGIAGGLLMWLLRTEVRKAFGEGPERRS